MRGAPGGRRQGGWRERGQRGGGRCKGEGGQEVGGTRGASSEIIVIPLDFVDLVVACHVFGLA